MTLLSTVKPKPYLTTRKQFLEVFCTALGLWISHLNKSHLEANLTTWMIVSVINTIINRSFVLYQVFLLVVIVSSLWEIHISNIADCWIMYSNDFFSVLHIHIPLLNTVSSKQTTTWFVMLFHWFKKISLNYVSTKNQQNQIQTNPVVGTTSNKTAFRSWLSSSSTYPLKCIQTGHASSTCWL